MTFSCDKCGACCRAVKCDRLKDNLCSIYDTRPTICRVDEMARIRGLERNAAYIINKHCCHILREKENAGAN